MLFLGFISVLQIICIPGFIIISLFKIKTDSAIQKWLYMFSFSLFFNYGLVTILTLFSIYTYLIMWGIVIFETLILLIYCRTELSNLFNSLNFRVIYLKFQRLLKTKSPGERIIIVISSLIVLFYTAVFIANIGTIFYFIDTVNNYEWNRWAIDFANNILPKYSSHFPQLIPANWSVCYVMIGKTDVHFFPKAIMPLFFISNLLIFVDLANTKKDVIYLAGLIIYGLFAPIIYSLIFIADGNADLPVSFMAFLTFYTFINIYDNSFKLRDYLITFLFASMAAATKLAGFYTFTIASLMLGLMLFIKRKELSLKIFTRIIIFVFLTSVISLFWYFRAPQIMVSGLNQPEYLPKTDHWNIAIHAIKLMYSLFGLPVFAFFIVTIAFSFLHKKVRFVSLIMVLIPTIIWMFKFSVDFRNLSFVVPFLSFCSAIGLSEIILFSVNRKSNIAISERNESQNRENSPADLTGSLSKKNRNYLKIISAISAVLLLIFISNEFYRFLFNIYNFMDKYYFQRNRNQYFIEYDLLLHIDFYQRVMVVLSSLGIILPVFILYRIRFNFILLLLAASLFFFNFTSVKKETILKHQEASFNKVDARNYFNWLKMYINSGKLKNEINTNFQAIVTDKIHRDIKFNYMPDASITFLQTLDKKNLQVFLSQNNLSVQTKSFIKSKIEKKEYKLIFDDNYYVFFVMNPL